MSRPKRFREGWAIVWIILALIYTLYLFVPRPAHGQTPEPTALAATVSAYSPTMTARAIETGRAAVEQTLTALPTSTGTSTPFWVTATPTPTGTLTPTAEPFAWRTRALYAPIALRRR